MLERLPLLNGILTNRATIEAQEQEAGVSGGTAEPAGSRSSSTRYSPAGTRSRTGSEVEHVESSKAMLTGHPALAGLVDYVAV